MKDGTGRATVSLRSALRAWPLLLVILLAACGNDSLNNANGLAETAANDRASNMPASRKTDWVRFGFDPARSGVNPEEKTITPGTVGGLHRLWSTNLPDTADSSPALLHDLEVSGKTRDVLYTTTKDGRIVALDAGSGKLLWSHKPSGPDLTTSSPVVDPSKKLVFSYGLDGSLHKYAAATGKEQKEGSWPARITTMPDTEKESSALNIADGLVYVTTSGYLGDAPPYQGHVVAVDEASGRSEVFNSLCSDIRRLLSDGGCSSQHSGIWGRGGAVVDSATNSVFTTSGNGPFDADSGGNDYGDSVLKLGKDDLRLRDSYTPEDYRRLQEQDADLGSVSPALLPEIPESKTPYLLVQGGKDGKLRLIDRKNLSDSGGPGHVGGALQVIDSAGCGTFTQPVVWKGGGRTRLIVAGNCALASYRVQTDDGGKSSLKLDWKTDDQSTTPVLAGGVLFAATDGDLQALDPNTGRHLWSSNQKSAGGSIGDIHWESPIVANGRVYISDESGAMTAYGLGK